MTSSASELMVKLFIAKARALLHDPPHKAFVLKDHEKVARSLRKKILENAGPLSSGLEEAWSDVAKRADLYASSFDRWTLDLVYGASGAKYVFEYSGLLNIADPRYGATISPPEPSELERSVDRFAEELSRIMRDLADQTRDLGDLERAKILYSALYVLLEPLWILRVGVQSPADTRVPTHSTIDHLYATAAMVNMALQGDEPSGYLVRIDIPGVQKIVNAARRAGDFWAGSWLLSNLVWGTVKRFIREYGPDILISPSPRLNPYLALEIIESVKNRLGEKGEAAVERICEAYTDLLKKLGLTIIEKKARNEGKCGSLRETIKTIPLIPATAILILPSIGAAEDGGRAIDDIEKRIRDSYVEAWREILEEMERELEERARNGSQQRLYEIALKTLRRYREDLLQPPTGARIDVVSLRDVYIKLAQCLEGSKDACRDLELDVEKDDTKFEERLEKLRKILKDLKIESKELAKKLAWHIAITKSLERARRDSKIPLPRAFWTARSQGLETKLIKDRNWKTCSLDGEEPAIIHLGKKFEDRERRSVEEEQYDEEKLREFLKEIGYSDEEIRIILGDRDLISSMKRIFIRPGEALGPYCLFKRLVYMAYSRKLRETLSFESTDDVMLAKIGEAFDKIGAKKYKMLENVIEKICGEEICKEDKKCLETCKRGYSSLLADFLLIPAGGLKEPRNFKDICMAAEGLSIALQNELGGLDIRISCDRFIMLSDAILKKACRDQEEFREDVKLLAKELLKEYPGAEDLIEMAGKEISNLCGLRSSYAIIKADADNMGKLLSGDLGAFRMKLIDYINTVLRELREKAKVISAQDGRELYGSERSAAMEDLGARMKTLIELIKYIEDSDERLVISPSYSYSLSASLMITSLRDISTIIGSLGFPIYSGGDDLLALSPIESSIAVALRTREAFHGEGMFHHIAVNGSKIPVAPAIPSGRSYSVRIASIKDVMGAEIGKAINILQEKAKEAGWVTWDKTSWGEKDTIVLSDSRSPTISLIPLSLWVRSQQEKDLGNFRREDMIKSISRLITIAMWAPVLGLISRGLPNDLGRELREIIDNPKIIASMKSGVEKIIERTIARNVKQGRESGEIGIAISRELLHSFKATDIADNRGLPLAIHIINIIDVMRGHP